MFFARKKRSVRRTPLPGKERFTSNLMVSSDRESLRAMRRARKLFERAAFSERSEKRNKFLMRAKDSISVLRLVALRTPYEDTRKAAVRLIEEHPDMRTIKDTAALAVIGRYARTENAKEHVTRTLDQTARHTDYNMHSKSGKELSRIIRPEDSPRAEYSLNF